MADLGVDPHIIEQCLNHFSGHRRGVAGVYNRSNYERAASAAFARWSAHLIALVRGANKARLWHCGAPELTGRLAGRLGFAQKGGGSTTFYSPGGRSMAPRRPVTAPPRSCDAGGNTTARSVHRKHQKNQYDSRGNVISRETTTGNTTTVYDPAGRNVGASRAAVPR